jgi:hypothetical protein
MLTFLFVLRALLPPHIMGGLPVGMINRCNLFSSSPLPSTSHCSGYVRPYDVINVSLDAIVSVLW